MGNPWARNHDAHPSRRVGGWERILRLRVADLTTIDMSLADLLGPQLDAVLVADGEAIGISSGGPFVEKISGTAPVTSLF